MPPVHVHCVELLGTRRVGDEHVGHHVLPLVPCDDLEHGHHCKRPVEKICCRPDAGAVFDHAKLFDSDDGKHGVYEDEEDDDVDELGEADDERLHDDPDGLDHLHEANDTQDPESFGKLAHNCGICDVRNRTPDAHKQVKGLPNIVQEPSRPKGNHIEQHLEAQLPEKDGVLDEHHFDKPRLRVGVIAEHKAEVDNHTASREQFKPIR
mmetsp:Transcript_29730/g.69484  ORF Transcript_29730/g.69484 Transcript_29730/m.69484 type:complete len:208 (+) Transcript_29730:1551-2174(+)